MRTLLTLGMLVWLPVPLRSAAQQNPNDALPPVGPDFEVVRFHGRVINLTDKSVVVKPEGCCTSVLLKPRADGTCQPVAIYRQDNTAPARTFVFDPGLFPNRPNTKIMGYREHYATDVRPGDVVMVGFRRVEGVFVCTIITIERRPGGRVPPGMMDHKLNDSNEYERRFDTRMNAEQFVEEQVIPVGVPRLFRKFRW